MFPKITLKWKNLYLCVRVLHGSVCWVIQRAVSIYRCVYLRSSRGQCVDTEKVCVFSGCNQIALVTTTTTTDSLGSHVKGKVYR